MGLGAGGLGALALGGAACAWLALGQPMPRMLGWSSPLASCLEREGLHAGLADYWIARRTSAASDWRVQIEPLDANGAARVWGNDWSWFAHATLDPSRRPAYRFIVTDRLPLATIGSVYGAPDRVATCAGATIWVYDDPNRLFDSLAHASPFLADTFATAPAGP